ncbi:MAG: metallophosphoesterase family protein [Polyangiaceae bacterium]
MELADRLKPPSGWRGDRRRWLQLALGCCGGAGAAWALGVEPRWLEVTEHRIPVPGLPQALEGFAVAQLSDLHLSGVAGIHERVLDELRQRAPQLVVVTGDAVEDTAHLPALGELCAALRTPGRQVIATRGNWEHWGQVPVEELRAVYQRATARLLINEPLALDGVTVMAIDDACSGHADAEAAMRSAAPAPARLLLTHAPGILDELPASAPRFDLALAGHTHGGQVRAGTATVWVPPGSGRFRAGRYQTAQGPAYVSRGIGTSVLAVRMMCRPELPIFRLVRG